VSPRQAEAVARLRQARRIVNSVGRLGFGDLFWPEEDLAEACAAIDGAARSIIGSEAPAPAAPEVERG
jgi:hypothetical protein